MKLEIKCLLREPYAGNLHVRFEEGEGGQRTGQNPESWLPLYSTVKIFPVALVNPVFCFLRLSESGCAETARLIIVLRLVVI